MKRYFISLLIIKLATNTVIKITKNDIIISRFNQSVISNMTPADMPVYNPTLCCLFMSKYLRYNYYTARELTL
ncbi:hypothetical protein GCM10025884_20270 [Leuconostoc gelidum subsp. gelidum]|nr:hypothetical protein GCM10025884_20270 [Leuconostoc gelidum subsp. gelidum]